MNAKIDKSRVMKRAWAIYRGHNPYSGDFRESLRRAWFVEKETVRYVSAQIEREKHHPVSRAGIPSGNEFQKGAAEYYRTAPMGTYFGD